MEKIEVKKESIALFGTVLLMIACSMCLFFTASGRAGRFEALSALIPLAVMMFILAAMKFLSLLEAPAGSSREEREAESKLWHYQVKTIREQMWENQARLYREKFSQGKRFVIYNYGNIYDANILGENEVLLEFNGKTSVITIPELKKMLAIENTEIRKRGAKGRGGE